MDDVIKDLTDSFMDAWAKQTEMSDLRDMAHTQQLFDAMNASSMEQQQWRQHQEHMQKLDDIDHDIRMSSFSGGWSYGHEDPEPSFIMALIVVAIIVGFCVLNACI